jgi:hypothetical protein
MRGNTVRKNGKRYVQSIIKVPSELIKLHQVVEFMINIFCQQTHFIHYLQHEDLLFHCHPFDDACDGGNLGSSLGYIQYVPLISVDQEFAAINKLTTVLPTALILNWAAASQHCGLIKCNICFLKEKICLVRHSLPFTTVPGIMVVRMVLHIINL